MKSTLWLSLTLFLCQTILFSQSIDPTFTPSILRGSGAFGIVSQPDGKFLVSTANNNFLNDVPVRSLFRMNGDGTADPAFQYSEEIETNPVVFRLQQDGKIVIGGRFYDREENFLGNLLRLFPDGSLDPDFVAFADEELVIKSLAVLPNEKIFAAGGLSTDTGQVHSILLFEEDGGIATHFPRINFTGDRPDNNVDVAKVDFQSDNELIVAGSNLEIAGLKRDLWRLDSLGVPDLDFDPAFQSVSNFRIRSIGILPDGSIGIMAGDLSNFTIVNRDGTSRVAVRLLNAQNIQETSIVPYGEDSFFIIGGNFHQVFTSGVYRDFLHLNSDRAVLGIAAQEVDSTLTVAGQFTNIAGAFKPGLLRLKLVDELVIVPRIDESFDAGIYTKGAVTDMIVQEDEKLVIAGTFHLVDGQRVNHVARLFPDGSLDTTFNFDIAQINRSISGIEQQNNGNLVLSGRYVFPPVDNLFNGVAITNKDGFEMRNLGFSSQFCGTGCGSSIPYLSLDRQDRIYAGMSVAYRSNNDSGQDLNRFSADGFLEADYNQLYINSISRYNGFAVLPNDQLLLYGHQINYDGSDSTYIIRADEDGQRDINFQPPLAKDLRTSSVLALNADFALVGGNVVDERRSSIDVFFHKLDSTGQIVESLGQLLERDEDRIPFISRMQHLPGGKILLSGSFNTYDGQSISHNAVVIDRDGRFFADYFPEAQTFSVGSLASIDENRYYLSGTFDFGAGTTAVVRIDDDRTSIDPSVSGMTGQAYIFPNPLRKNEDVLHLRLDRQLSGINVPYQIIEAATGKVIRSGRIVARDNNQLKTGALPAGSYYLRLVHPQVRDGFLFVKQ